MPALCDKITVARMAERGWEILRAQLRAHQRHCSPNRVNLEYFTYGGISERRTRQMIVFTGSMDWLANVDGIEFFMDEAGPGSPRARPRAGGK
jgi:hypothetical protein